MQQLINNADFAWFEKLCQQFNLQHQQNSDFALIFNSFGIELKLLSEPKIGSLKIDFNNSKLQSRARFLNHKNELLAKAIGVTKKPFVIDATAGLARESFLLANWGCKVLMFEQNNAMRLLIYDALNRAKENCNLNNIVSRLELSNFETIFSLDNTDADVIYLDPMFAPSAKNRLVKKDMQILQKFLSKSQGCELLVTKALELAPKVVLKRAKNADFLAGKPEHSYKNESIRFDVYYRK